MIKLFSSVKDSQENAKADSLYSDLDKLNSEMTTTRMELQEYKNKINQAKSELTKITVNLEKTKFEFEQLFTLQKIKKKDILQLENEHKFILRELALFGKLTKKQLAEKTTTLDPPLYQLIKKTILETMNEEINKEYKTQKELDSFAYGQINQKYQNVQNIDSEKRFLYY